MLSSSFDTEEPRINGTDIISRRRLLLLLLLRLTDELQSTARRGATRAARVRRTETIHPAARHVIDDTTARAAGPASCHDPSTPRTDHLV